MRKAGIRERLGVLLLLPALLFCACAGPSTRVLPREDQEPERKSAENLPAVNPDGLREMLEELSAEPRPAGSRAAGEAEAYLTKRLVSFGYEVSEQDGIVTAVRRATGQNADILLAEAEYGTEEGCPGALTGASGAAVLLETARILASFPSDTELRLYFLPTTPEDGSAARVPASQIDEEQSGRILGLVRVGAQGVPDQAAPALVTSDGKDTFLASCIRDSVSERTGFLTRTLSGDRPVCSIFERAFVPAVSFEDTAGLYEQGTALETAGHLDVTRLAQAADALSLAFAGLMDEDTLSMRAKAHYYNDIRDTAYVQRQDAVLPFGESRETLERLTGQTGALTAQNRDQEGRAIDAWQYPMKWFGVDQIIPTTCYYLDGKLSSVVPDADSAGVDMDEIMERVTSFYGEYTGFSNTPAGTEYEWAVPERRLTIRLVPEKEGYELSFSAMDAARVPVAQESLGADILLGEAGRIFPQEALERITFTAYTDGIGGTEGYLEEIRPEDETEENAAIAGLGLDVADALDEEGVLKDEARTMRLLIRLYAQYLKLAQPERYTDPDFEQDFLLYLLAGETDRAALGLERYEQYEELVSYRSWVRKNLNRG